MRTTTKLKGIMAGRTAVTVPGAANALFARVIEDLGFEVVYVTGAGVANMPLGAPDVGLTTLTELAGVTAAIADSVTLPIIVDADTGFGNPVNMARTIRVLERAGAAGVQIEDQVFPKKCGHFEGKEVIPVREMVQKIKAAVDSRCDGDFQIIARTDARELPVPQVANIVFGGKTPDPGRRALADMGFSIVLYANAALQAALRASYEVLGALKASGSLVSVAERLASFEERQRAVAKHHWDALEARYKS